MHPSNQYPALIGAAALTVVGGCNSLPGNTEQQGTVAGGVAGAAAGALIAGEDDRLIGALIGGALGAGGGYLVGSNWDNLTGDDQEEALQAVEDARENPADAGDVGRSETADLDGDGYVTLDEVVAMEEAGLEDREIMSRLRATDQYFELADAQEDYLRDRGVSNSVILAMHEMSRESRDLIDDRLGDDRISRGGY